jgi:chitinase
LLLLLSNHDDYDGRKKKKKKKGRGDDDDERGRGGGEGGGGGASPPPPPLMPGQPNYYDYGAADAGVDDASGTMVATVDQQQQQQEQEEGSSNMDRDPTTTTSEGGGGAAQPQTQGTATTTTTTTTAAPHGTAKRIIGYYAGWQWYDRDKLADPENMDFRKVQRVNYAFFQTDALGNIYGTDRWGDPQLLFGPYSTVIEGGVQRCSYDGPSEVNCAYHAKQRGLIHKAHEQGAEVYPSIGGWTLSDNFPTMSADPVARDAFAKKCVEILSYHDFDGIDIDWEYPGYADHSGTPADTENFTRMLTAIREALELHTRETGRVYGLTAALPCAPENIANIEVGKLIHVLSEFNLMSYDFHGSWDGVTGTNAPLYYQGFGNEEFNIDRCVENYVALGVPRDRINIGLPFYGRSFKFASSLNQEHGGSDLANWPEDDGTPQYFNIRTKLPHMMQVRDNKSKTQYAYISHAEQEQQQQQQIQQILSPGGRALAEVTDTTAQSFPEGLVSFDDERAICDKVQYAQEKELGGFIIWELSGDVLEDLSTPLLDVANMKLAHPTFECCTLHSEEECETERLEAEMANSQMMGFDVGGWTSSSGLDESGCEGEYRVASILRLSLGVFAATTISFW